jgi:hypothetical protein
MNTVVRAEHLNFESLLIMPIQRYAPHIPHVNLEWRSAEAGIRIPRYNLLLTDLLKHTQASHPDAAQLKTALRLTQETADFVNQSIRQVLFTLHLFLSLSIYISLASPAFSCSHR